MARPLYGGEAFGVGLPRSSDTDSSGCRCGVTLGGSHSFGCGWKPWRPEEPPAKRMKYARFVCAQLAHILTCVLFVQDA